MNAEERATLDILQAPPDTVAPCDTTLDEFVEVSGLGEALGLARLTNLHREAIENARLANLLGRLPAAAGLYAALGAIAVLYLCRGAAGAPFDRAGLRAFARNLDAVLLYAGFAWGAGAILAVPAAAGPARPIAFGTGGAALMAAVLRARAPTLHFLVPGLGLPVLAGAMGPQVLLFAGILLIFAGLLGGAADLLERRTAHRLEVDPARSHAFLYLPAFHSPVVAAAS